MHSKTLLLLLLHLYVSSLPLSLSQSNYFDRYVNCQPIPYSCGDIHFNLSYPFYLENAGRPDYCGLPDFHLTCISNNSTLTTSINGLNYQVTSLNTSSRVLGLVAGSFVGQMCPRPYFNTTFNFSDFEYTADVINLTVYSNCTEKPTTLYNISCLSEDVGKPSPYYAVEENGGLDAGERCRSVTVVPMRRTMVEELRNGSLSFGNALGEGFELRWVIGSEWCGSCIDSGGVCGYNSRSPNSPTCFCPYGPYGSFNGSCPQDDSIFYPERSKPKKGITIEVPAIVGSLLVLLFFLVYILQRNKPWKKASDDEETVKNFLQNYGSLSPKRYKYSEVKKMTQSFTQIFGKGGYGTVYKGTLPDGHAVAVKILNESKGTNEDFMNKVASITRTSHVNVVGLLGFCLEKSKRALVYDFMPNGSLEKFIYTDKSTSSEASLDCQKLYEIAIGIARGLEYLHRGCNTRIVHFDIKPHNILLDQDFCPKISDFGLAKLCHAKESILSMCGMRGTPGYIAPEIFSRQFGVVSSKSDAYSYGMMVLEMVVGKGGMDGKAKSGNGGSSSSEVYFPQGIYEHLEQYEDEVMSESDEIVKRMILVGLWCIQTMPGDRPTMSRVVEMLEGSLGDIKIPPRPKLF